MDNIQRRVAKKINSLTEAIARTFGQAKRLSSEPIRESGTMTLVLRMLPDRNDRLLKDSTNTLVFNAASFRHLPTAELRGQMRLAILDAMNVAAQSHQKLLPNIDFKPFTEDVLAVFRDPSFDDAVATALVRIVALYQSQIAKLDGHVVRRGVRHYPDYDDAQHPALVRYGNVELRVIENYLLTPTALKTALGHVTRKLSSEQRMYSESNSSSHLIHDDPDFNLRSLMTNAGFYSSSDPDAAWQSLDNWAKRYTAALSQSHLSWHNAHAHYYLRIQRAIFERFGTVPRYVRAPSARAIYANIEDKEVLFVSPLSHIVNEQVSSGRLWKLYKNYEPPRFSLRAIPAWISTWPNRPHSDWSETFARMCDSVDQAHHQKPFQFFIAACGCYGLPICEYVRSRFGAPVLYVGNFAHTVFGIRPNSPEFKVNLTNEDMWRTSDLARYDNVSRIDHGRYV